VHWLAPKLQAFSQAHPHVDIRYISNIWVKELDGEDDMEIRWGHGQWPGLVSQRLTWDTLFPVCSPDLMAKSPLTVPADVSNHPLLHVLGYEEGWGTG
jgi:LysR family glycine cleavage system transcriptional activator